MNILIDCLSPGGKQNCGMIIALESLIGNINKHYPAINFSIVTDQKGIAFWKPKSLKYIRLIEVNKPTDCVESFDITLHPFNLVFNEFKSKANILIVHDITPFKFKHGLSYFKNANADPILKSAEKCQAVITISDIVKYDLINYLDISKEKIFSCKSSVDNSFLHERICHLPKPKEIRFDKYILYPSAPRPHKNPDRLLHALRAIDPEIRPRLVVSTAENYNNPLIKEFQALIEARSQKPFVQVINSLDRTQYCGLLHNADGVIFPSLSEGLGLGVLETIIAKRPLACASTSSLIEVAEGYAHFFDPYNTQEIANSLTLLSTQKLSTPEHARQSAIDKYSSINQANEYVNVLNLVYHKTKTSRYNFEYKNILTQLKAANILQELNLYRGKLEKLYSSSSLAACNNRILKESIDFTKLQLIKKSNGAILTSEESHQPRYCLLLDVGRLAGDNLFSGISRYTKFILEHALQDKYFYVLPFFSPLARGVIKKDTFMFYINEDLSTVVLDYSSAIKIAESMNLKVFYHSTYYPLPKIRSPKFTYSITIHDVFHLTNLVAYPKGQTNKYLTSEIVNSIQPSDNVIAVSRYSLGELQAIKPNLAKYGVAYLPPMIDANISCDYDAAEWPKREYDILIFNQNDPRKNFKTTIEFIFNTIGAMIQPSQKLKIKLVSNTEVDLSSYDHNKFEIDIVRSVDDHELVRIFKSSKIFLYLSTAEGFGLPPLEAMKLGCIPIIYDNTALGEIYATWPYMYSDDSDLNRIAKDIMSLISVYPAQDIFEKTSSFVETYNPYSNYMMFIANLLASR